MLLLIVPLSYVFLKMKQDDAFEIEDARVEKFTGVLKKMGRDYYALFGWLGYDSIHRMSI